MMTHISFRNIVTVFTFTDKRKFIHIQILAALKASVPGSVGVDVFSTTRTGDDEQSAFQIEIDSISQATSNQDGNQRVDEENQYDQKEEKHAAAGTKMYVGP